MTVGLLQRKLEDLQQRLATWLPERREETVREVLSLAGKLHHAAYVVRPRRYFVRRLLRLTNQHLTEESSGGGDAWGRLRRKAEAERRLECGVLEIVREPGGSEVRGTADGPIRPVREARAVETMVPGRVIPGRWRILLGDRVEIWTDRRREEADSEGKGQDGP